MTVIPRKRRNRIPLTGLLHTLFLLVAALAAVPAGAAGARAPEPSQFTPAGDEVPFVVSPSNVTRAMLDIAGVTARDRLIDLGSGDGRIVITAARQFGASGLGVEIVPDLVAKSNENAKRAEPWFALDDLVDGKSVELVREDQPAIGVVHEVVGYVDRQGVGLLAINRGDSDLRGVASTAFALYVIV